MSGTKTDARKNPRVKVGASEITYLNFDSGNGAIVVDVSAEGLGFQAADPLRANESLAFRLCAPDLPNIDLTGTIAWLDETRKRGGLRLKVSPHARAALEQWQRRYLGSLPEAKAAVRSVPPAPPLEPRAKPRTPAADGRVAQNPPASEPAPRPIAPNPMERDPIFVSRWEYPPEESHTGRHALVVAVILALGLALAGSYYLGGRRQIGAILIQLGQYLAGAPSQAQLQNLAAKNADALPPPQPKVPAPSDAAPAPAATQPSPTSAVLPAPGTASTPAAATASAAAPAAAIDGSDARSASARDVPAPHAPTNPGNSGAAAPPRTAVNGSHSRPRNPPAAPIADAVKPSAAPHARPAVRAPAPPPLDQGEGELAQARQYLHGSNPEDSAVAASLLWSAIGKGNTQAELILADLYLRGRGAVRQNCEQAEALLRAAQSAEVPGATDQLQELQTYGCR